MLSQITTGLCIVALLLLAACRMDVPAESSPLIITPHDRTDIVGLATPIQLQRGQNRVIVKDYFMEPSRIDSVVAAPGITASLTADKQYLELTADDPELPPLSNLELWVEGRPYDILLKSPREQRVTLRLPDRGYQAVAVKGDMNAWNPNSSPLRKVGDTWQIDFDLNPGNYSYLYVVDGQEMRDPDAPTVPSDRGGTNSQLQLAQPDDNKLPRLRTDYAEDNRIGLQATNNPDEVFVYWGNYRIEMPDGEFDGMSFTIPAAAADMERSHVRVWSYNEEGLSNDLLIPLQGRRAVLDAADLTRSDYEAQIMYFVLIDRFNDGNPANNDPLDDPRVLPPANYQGGDLEGIIQKIEDGYFASMNVNSLWLSPITQNPYEAYQEYIEPQRWYSGYHGYWPILSSKVDYRFGDEATMKRLVEVAHDNGINILLDYVCNHVHELHPIYQNHPEWATSLMLPEGKRNLRLWDEQRTTTWFDTFLPTLDLSDANPEGIDVQTDSALYWLEEYDLDGYRQDATKHVPTEFWRTLTRKAKERVMVPQGKPIYQIGETYGSRPLINSYISTGLLNSQFDFNVYFDAREVLAKGSEGAGFELLASSLKESFNYYGHHSTMGYMSGNHDQARYISLAGSDLSFSEDHREAGWSRDVQVGDDIGYNRLQMLHAFNMTIPGVPVIYYGDEIGIPGAGDPDSRRMMYFEGWKEREAETKQVLEKLARLRNERLSLTYGDTEYIHQTGETFAFARMYFDEITIAAFNKSSQPKTIALTLPTGYKGVKLSPNFKGNLTQEGNQLMLTLPPASYEVLVGERS